MISCSRTHRHLVPTLILAGLLAVCHPAAAVDFLVTSTADQVDVNPGDGVCDADASSAVVCTLRAAIQEANALPNDPSAPAPGNIDRIGIYGGTYTLTIAGRDEDLAATGDLDITETLQIFGDENDRPVIDGGALDRVFDILIDDISAVSITDVTIENGSAVGSGLYGTGGGIRCDSGGTMIIANTQVLDNAAEVFGGGIHNEGCEFYATSSLVQGNRATGGSGGSGAGGGISSRFGDLVLSLTTVRGNAAEAGPGASGGGGLMLTAVSSDRYAYIYRSSIVGNTADWGAGITSGMRLYVINSVVADNDGTFGGGGGIRTFGELILQSSTVYGNRVTSSSNAAGIYFQGSSPSAVMDHTIVAGNTNGSGPADCTGVTLESQGYNLIGHATDCTLTGSGTGDQLGVDPGLVGPIYRPRSSGMAGGQPAWMPRSAANPSVDAGDPAGSTYDHDADPGTAGTTNVDDRWGTDRPYDGDRDGTGTVDLGAVEFDAIFVETFGSGDVCYWTDAAGAAACP